MPGNPWRRTSTGALVATAAGIAVLESAPAEVYARLPGTVAELAAAVTPADAPSVLDVLESLAAHGLVSRA